MPVQKPRARTDDLVIEEVDDELLVYDSTNKRGHCLSATAARVWRACDGHSDVSALSEALELNAEVVSQALDELEALELLDTQGVKVVQAGSGNGDGLTRRQLARRSATVGAGIAAAPLVYSINVSSAMALATPTNPFQCALFTTQACGTSSGCGAIVGLLLLLPRRRRTARSAARPPSATTRTRSRAAPLQGGRLRHRLLQRWRELPADAARLLRRHRRECSAGAASAPVLRAAATRTHGRRLARRARRRCSTASRAATARSLLQSDSALGCCKSATRQLLRPGFAHAGRGRHAATRRALRRDRLLRPPHAARPAAPPTPARSGL